MKIRNLAIIKSLLLDNKTSKQTIFKNTFWLAITEGITNLLRLILLIYVARVLGVTEYGKFTFALAFVSLFAIFSDLGLSTIITREFSREREKEKEFSSIFTLKILLSLGALILMLAGSFFVSSDSTIRAVIWILSVYILTNSFSEIIYAFLRARQKMQYESWARILQVIVLIAAGFFVILNFPSVKNLSYSYLFASLVTLIFILIFFYFKISQLRFSWNKTIWQRFLAMSWPLGFIALFAVIYNQIDSVMLGYWGQIAETGWYNAAYKITNTTLIPATLLSTSFYPALSIAFRQSKERLQEVWNYRTGIIILIAIPLVVGGIVLAPKIINFIYNPSFFPSIFPFQILMMVGCIYYFISPLSQILVVSNQQRKNFWIDGSGATVNIILNLILIPKYSLYGAAIATLITFFLMFVLYFISTVKFTTVKPLNFKIFLILLATVFCSIPMYLTISWPLIYNLNVLLIILIGATIYLISLFIFNKIFKLDLSKI